MTLGMTDDSDHASEQNVSDQLPVLDAFGKAFDAEYFGAWTFCTLVRGTEWNPALFTSVINDCGSKLANTLQKARILSYACLDQSTLVPDGYVAIEGFLIMNSPNKVRRGTLRRYLQHPNLRNPENPNRESSIEWRACKVGKAGRFNEHDWIKKFQSETALPPAGVLQRSADVVGPRLRVDYLGPSSPQPGRLGRPWRGSGRGIGEEKE